MATKPRSSQVRHIQNTKHLGLQSGANAESLFSKINTELDVPLKLHATFPTADAKLNFSDSLITAADGAKKVMPAVADVVVTNLSGAWINFQTQSLSNASHFTITWPGTNTVGYFRHVALFLGEDQKINAVFSAEAATEGALSNPGALFTAGIPIGYVTLECTNASGYFKTAGSSTDVIENAKIFRIAAGGGAGSGDTGAVTEETLSLRNSLNSTEFKYLSPIVFKTDKDDFIDTVNSTGTYNNTDSTYDLSSGQILRSVDLLDSAFILEKQDIEKAMLTVFYKQGSVDTGATYQISRDNGTTWQTVTLTRNSQTTEFSGVKAFTAETLSTEGTLADTTTEVLNTTTNKKLSQKFTLTNNRLVKVFTVKITKTGSPGGKITAKLVKDSSGNPSSANADLISSKTIDIPSLSAGINTVNIDFGLQMLASGDYHIVFETDDPYQSSFSAGVTEVLLRTKSPFTGNEAKKYDGSSWSTVTNENIEFTYTYKVPSLLVRITASATSRITGLGVLYGEEPLEVSPVSKIDIIVGSPEQVDAGIATHSSIQNALTDAGFGRIVRILAGTYVGAVTVSQSDLTIVGEGRQSIIQGNVTISGDHNMLKDLKIDGDLTFNATSEYNTILGGWLTGSLTDSGTNNSITLILE